MLVIKTMSNIFFTSIYVCPPVFPPTRYLLRFVSSLSVPYSEFIGGEVWRLFIFLPHLYVYELPTKYPREKILNARNTP